MVVYGAGAEIAFNASGGAADWIMLMPLAGGMASTIDGRGPYRVSDAAKLAAASLTAHSGRIPIDENHSTDLAAPRGEPAPARGWATKLEARTDGIYGHVEWNPAGAQLMSEKAYRFISPVLIHDKAGNVLDMPRASLTNVPNLVGMASLHAQENDMDLLAQLRQLLNLGDDADANAVVAKIRDACGNSTAMQSIAKEVGLTDVASASVILGAVKDLKKSTALQSVAKAAGLKDDADLATIVSTVTTLAASGGDAAKQVVALQSELKELGGKLETALKSTATDKATAFVDAAIREGRVGVKALRDHFIARHAASAEGAAGVEKEIGALPKVANGALLPSTPPAKEGETALNSEQQAAARLLGIDPKAYAKTLESERAA